MATYSEMMKKLRESLPQGSDEPESARKTMPDIKDVTPISGKKNLPYTPGEEGKDSLQLLKSDSSAGVDVDEDTDADEPMGDLDIGPDEDSEAQTDFFMSELKKKGDAFKAAQTARKVTAAKKPKVEVKSTTDKQDGGSQNLATELLGEIEEAEKLSRQERDSDRKEPTDEEAEEFEREEDKAIDDIKKKAQELTGEEGDEDTDSPEVEPLTVNDQGLQVNEAVVADHGDNIRIDDTEGETDIFDILDQHEKNIRGDMSDEDREEAAGIDFDRDFDEGEEIYSGDGPGGKGEVFFFDNPDGGSPRGYIVFDDGSVQVVTGMLFPPGYKQK